MTTAEIIQGPKPIKSFGRGHGYGSARVMFIADGMTDEDVAHGECISGNQLKLINGWCNSQNIKPADCYYTALIKERINLKDARPRDKNPKKDNVNGKLATDEYKGILEAEINAISPNILVPLSELSFEFCTGLTGIRKFRGSVLSSRINNNQKQIRVVPILGQHPFINEDYKQGFISRLDFEKIAKNIDKTGEIHEVGIIWIAKNSNSLREYFSRQYSIAKFVVFDIETFCGIPTCISFCFDGNESVTVPILDYTISQGERVLMLDLVSRMLATNLPKVNQNVKFDWKKLERQGIKVNNVLGDTLLATSCLFPEFPKNLGFLTSIYTDMPYFKDEGKQFDPAIHNRERLYLYCAKDSLATHKIYTNQVDELIQTGTDNVYRMLIDILPIYKRAEEIGIRIDEQQRVKLTAKYETKFNIQAYKLQLLVGETINPLSDDQVRKLVYEELKYTKIRGIKSTKSGAPGTDEESLEILMWRGESSERNSKEILRTIINCRKLHKVIEYLVSPLHPDNRARCEFNLAGTETGRTTTGKTTDNCLIFDKKGKVKLVDLGRSFQNIGKHGFSVEGEDCGQDLRSMFVPDVGFCFIESDLSQAEARVDAVLARDYDILSVFDGPIGIHRLTGSWIFQCPPEEIKKNILVDGKDRYHEAKTARHAGERNMKETRLMMMIHRPINECTYILKTFHTKQPNIRGVFHKEIEETLRKTRVLTAPNGRRRQFFGRWDEDMINEGISFLPQAIVTDQIKQGLKRTFDACDYALPLSESHDSFLAMVPLEKRQEYGIIFKQNTEIPIDFKGCSLSRDFKLVIPVETEWSKDNWQRMEKLRI